MLLLIPLTVGCEGCRSDGRGEQAPQEETQDPFLTESLRTLPSNADSSIGIKPSHWTSARQKIKSTQTDVRGELRSRVRCSVEDVGTSEDLYAKQKVILPRGQWRDIEYRVFPKQTADRRRPTYVVENRLSVAGKPVGLPSMRKVIQPNEILKSQEYFFLVLTTRPERFARFQGADWIKFQSNDFRTADSESNFRLITLSEQESRLPLPETIFDWTSIAVVLWDDLSTEALTSRQQQAIADWVRHGGVLILNGATPSETLAYTALQDLVPMRMDSRIELDTGKAKKLLVNWTVSGDATLEKQLAILNQSTAGISLLGPLRQEAQYVPQSDSLLTELTVGHGQVIQTRFDLTSDWIRNWGSYDSFVNSVILRRPRREVRSKLDPIGERIFQQVYPDYGTAQADPAFNTRFRIASRDAFLPSGDLVGEGNQSVVSRYDSTTAIDSQSGIGGWRATSDFVRLGTDILRKQSGIPIPEAKSAIFILVSYLLILVPVNYLIFRLLGRLEWFWIAVPLVAFVGTIVVARTIQLDIGFARSQSEIALLEIHEGYQRAHLTRLVAVYNSLSSDYQVAFDSPDVAVEPIKISQKTSAENAPILDFAKAPGLVLDGFPVQSNQSRMLRVEQMVDLGGMITLSVDNQIKNLSRLGFREAVAFRKTSDGQIQSAIIGRLDPGQEKRLEFVSRTGEANFDELPSQLSNLLSTLAQSDLILPGSTRLIGWYDGVLEGMEMIPEMDQEVGRTLAIAHLRLPEQPDPKIDVNLASQLREKLKDKEVSINESFKGINRR